MKIKLIAMGVGIVVLVLILVLFGALSSLPGVLLEEGSYGYARFHQELQYGALLALSFFPTFAIGYKLKDRPLWVALPFALAVVLLVFLFFALTTESHLLVRPITFYVSLVVLAVLAAEAGAAIGRSRGSPTTTTP